MKKVTFAILLLLLHLNCEAQQGSREMSEQKPYYYVLFQLTNDKTDYYEFFRYIVKIQGQSQDSAIAEFKKIISNTKILSSYLNEKEKIIAEISEMDSGWINKKYSTTIYAHDSLAKRVYQLTNSFIDRHDFALGWYKLSNCSGSITMVMFRATIQTIKVDGSFSNNVSCTTSISDGCLILSKRRKEFVGRAIVNFAW